MNYNIKRWIAMILVMCLMLQPTLYAHAEGTADNIVETEKNQTMQIKMVNPRYEGIISEEDLKDVPADIPTTFAVPRYTDDMEEIGAIIRQAMVERVETFTVYYYLKNGIESDSHFNNIMSTMIDKALEETSNSYEGEYLCWQYGGFSSEASFNMPPNGIGVNMDLTFSFTYYSTAEQEEMVNDKLETVLWETLDLDDSSLTNYQKTKLIYDYLCENVVYDYENLDNPDYTTQFTAYGALINGTSVCQGYAVLMYRMMEEAGIDTRVVVGDARGPHAWNISKLGNKYYYSDSTWDAGYAKYSYFLKGYSDFEKDHTPDGCSVVYEDKYVNVLSATDFVPGQSEETEIPENPKDPEEHLHSLLKIPMKAATCEKSGNVEHYKCEECGKLYKDVNGDVKLREADVYIAAQGHKYGVYKTTRKAMFGAAGVKTAVCTTTGCGKSQTQAIPAAKTPVISPSSYTFNNKNRKLSTNAITVKDTNGNNLSYYVTYTIRKNVGKYAVTVKLTDADYTGTKTIYYSINPKGVSISKATAAKKAFTVKWKKPSSTYRKQMTGYQVRYSTSSKMSKAKTVTVKSTTSTSKKIRKLKAKKIYYVQLRTYKKIGSKTYYSGWSKTKKVKTK